MYLLSLYGNRQTYIETSMKDTILISNDDAWLHKLASEWRTEGDCELDQGNLTMVIWISVKHMTSKCKQ